MQTRTAGPSQRAEVSEHGMALDAIESAEDAPISDADNDGDVDADADDVGAGREDGTVALDEGALLPCDDGTDDDDLADDADDAGGDDDVDAPDVAGRPSPRSRGQATRGGRAAPSRGMTTQRVRSGRNASGISTSNA